MTDFKIPDTPDTDSIWDRMGNEWQRKVYDWKCIQTGVARSWVELIPQFWSANGCATSAQGWGYSD